MPECTEASGEVRPTSRSYLLVGSSNDGIVSIGEVVDAAWVISKIAIFANLQEV